MVKLFEGFSEGYEGDTPLNSNSPEVQRCNWRNTTEADQEAPAAVHGTQGLWIVLDTAFESGDDGQGGNGGS